ncbi:MAG: hypothetical protein RLZZ172_3037, partial [Bacteroidota bacterium]
MNTGVCLKASTVVLFVILIAHSFVFGQRFGGNPTELKFKSLQGRYANVIYPEQLSGTAKRVQQLTAAQAMDKQYSLGGTSRKVPIV